VGFSRAGWKYDSTMANKKQEQTQTKEKAQNVPKLDINEIVSDWLAFPALLRRFSDDEFTKLGLDKTEIDPFMLIKTREELSKALGFDRRQLYRYERSEEVQKKKKEKQESWGRSKTPNIIAGLYKAAIIEGDAARVKLWFQLFEGWSSIEKIKIIDENDEKTDEELNKEEERLNERIAAIRKKAKHSKE